MVVPWMPAACHCRIGSHQGARLTGPAAVEAENTAASSASAGSGACGSSQPCSWATTRTTASLRRPISRARAICRSVSPWRNRTRICRY